MLVSCISQGRMLWQRQQEAVPPVGDIVPWPRADGTPRRYRVIARQWLGPREGQSVGLSGPAPAEVHVYLEEVE